MCISQVLPLSQLSLIQFTICGVKILQARFLAGVYFHRLLKLLHLSEFTLAAGQASCHNDIHGKMADLEFSEVHYK